MDSFVIKVPATSANIGPGFDTLGLALDLHNTMTFREIESGLSISVEGEGAHTLPIDETNLVYTATQILFDRVNYQPTGLQIHLNNQVPVGSGLGSSSTAIIGGLLGANCIAGSPLSRKDILDLATEVEGHPDNVAPALYGGLVIALQANNDVIVEQVKIRPIRVSIVMPRINILTREARAALPSMVPYADAIFNIGRSTLLIQALQTGNYAVLGVALEDKLHQPYRMNLMPSCKQACIAAVDAGAYGAALSGAGPSIIIFAPDDQHEQVQRSVRDAFSKASFGSRAWTLDVSMTGAQIEIVSAESDTAIATNA